MSENKKIVITLKNKNQLNNKEPKKLELIIKKKIQLKSNTVTNYKLKPPKIFGFKYF
jgi:hypothetical protein